MTKYNSFQQPAPKSPRPINQQAHSNNEFNNQQNSLSMPLEPPFKPPATNNHNNHKNPNEKRPFYKKFWFWLIIGIITFILIGMSGGNDTDNSTKPVSSANSSSQTTKNKGVTGSFDQEPKPTPAPAPSSNPAPSPTDTPSEAPTDDGINLYYININHNKKNNGGLFHSNRSKSHSSFLHSSNSKKHW